MKIYKIGRDPEDCDIVIDDPSDMTSRQHAVLKINKKGKYSIADCSSNGTYVNGIKIESGVEVPVTRKDRISFAHVIDLDWDFIPNPAKKMRIAIFSTLGGILLLCIIGGIIYYFHDIKVKKAPETPATEVVVDTAKVEQPAPKDTVTVEKPVAVKKPTPKPKSEPAPVKEEEPEKPAKITNPIL